ncbi:hypothetical protein [Streptomyces lunalinharesii]|uniref:Uncharacterized protein n=1 Tax=Streptomyces lunalinharesii TaxID=333384 RepID=A0ABP6F2U6_9ACTN
MARGGDWSVLGFGKDPTPGDTTVIQEIQNKMDTLKQLADDVNDGLTALLNQGEGKFVGKTADALRAKISGELKTFISALSESFTIASAGMSAYKTKMEEYQSKADRALTAAQALDKNADDHQTQLAGPKKDATDARLDFLAANRAMEGEVRRAGEKVKLPVSGWKIFWEIFSYMAIAVSVVAIFVGGPLGLLAFAMNAALFAKTAVDFAQGKASGVELALSVLGLLGPTTKAISFLSVLKGIGAGAKALGIAAKTAVVATAKGFYQIVTNPAGVGKLILSTIKAIPGAIAAGLRAVPAILATAGGFVASQWKSLTLAVKQDFFLSTWFATGTMGKVGAYVLTLGGRAFDLAVSALMPLHYGEIATVGYRGAFKLAVLERGFGLAQPGLEKLIVGQVAHAGLELNHPTSSLVSPTEMHAGLSGPGLHLDNAGFTTSTFTHLTENGPLTLGSNGIQPLQGVSSGLGDVGHGLNATDKLHALDEFSGLSRTDGGLLVPSTSLDSPGITSLGSHDLSMPSTHVESVGTGSQSLGFHGLDMTQHSTLLPSKIEIGGINTAGVGDGLGFAHGATKHADSAFEFGIPELKALSDGDVRIVSTGHNGITLQIGEPPAVSPGVHPTLGSTTTTHGVETVGGSALTTHSVDTAGGSAAVGTKGDAGLGSFKAVETTALTHDPTASRDLAMNLLGGKESLKAPAVKPSSVSSTASHALDESAVVKEAAIKAPGTDGVSAAGELDQAGAKVTGFDLAGSESSHTFSALDEQLVAVRPEPGPANPALELLDHGHSPAGTETNSALETAQSLDKGKEALQPTQVPDNGWTMKGETSAANMDAGRRGRFEIISGGKADSEGLARVQAWSNYEQSLSELGQSQRTLKEIQGADPTLGTAGESSKGVSLEEAQAKLEVSKAELKVANTEHTLETMGINPQVMQHDLQAMMVTRSPDDFRAFGGMMQPERPVRLTGGQFGDMSITTNAANDRTLLMDRAEVVTGSSVTRNPDGTLVITRDGGPSSVYAANGDFQYSELQLRSANSPTGITHIRTDPTGTASLVDGHGTPVGTHTLVSDAAGHTVTDNVTGSRWSFGADGRLQHHDLSLGANGPAGVTHIRTDAMDARSLVGGDGAAVDTHRLTSDATGHTLTDRATGNSWRYGADGTLQHSDVTLRGMRAPDGVAGIRTNAATNEHALLNRDGAPVGTHTLASDGTGHTLTNAAGDRWRYGADGTLQHFDQQLTHGPGPAPGGTATHIRTTPGSTNLTLADANGVAVAGHSVTDAGPTRGHIVENIAGDKWHYAPDRTLQMHETALRDGGITPPDGWHIGTGYGRDGRATLTLTNDDSARVLRHDVAAGGLGGGHTITEPGGHVWHINPDGTVNTHALALDGHGPDGSRFIHETHTPGGTNYTLVDRNGAAVGGYDVAPRGGAGTDGTPLAGHTVTHNATGNHWNFGGDGSLNSQRINLNAGNGANPAGHSHIIVDHGGPAPAYRTPGGTGHTVTPVTDARGNVTGFELRQNTAAGTHGNVWHYTTDGRLTREEVPLNLRNGITGQNTHLTTDYDAAGNATGHSLANSGTGVVDTDFRVTHNAVSGEYTVTQPTHAVRGNDYQVFGQDGTLSAERIAIHADGRPTGKYWLVDHANGAAFKVDGHGVRDRGLFTTGRPQRVGDRLTITSDGVIQFQRESLSGDRVLHVDASGTGKATHWMSFDSSGNAVRHGDRIFDPDRQTIHDTRVGGSNMFHGSADSRQYHTLSNGGWIRSEKGADGHWTWQRFDNNGTEVASGNRQMLLGNGWKDHYVDPTTGTTHLAQQKFPEGFGSNFDLSGKFREYGMTVDANNLAHVDDNAYKEFSVQNKPTASKEALANGNTLEVRRIAEQRIPAAWWHREAGLDTFHGGFANSTFTKDSLNQVFRWTEHDGAGNVTLTGIRKTAPDGSWADIDQAGRVVRGTRKLDNGKIVELGKDVTGTHWEAAPPRPAPGGDHAYTVNWRYTDGTLNGTRHVEANGNWKDTFTNAGDNREFVMHRSQDGGWREYKDEFPLRNAPDDNRGVWVDKNDLNQITGRRDHWDNLYVESHGNPRKNNWTWTSYDQNNPTAVADSGKRLNNRGSAHSPTWDDSFKDFDRNGNLVRERNVFDPNHWTDVTTDAGPRGTAPIFRVKEFDANGNVLTEGHRIYAGKAGGDRWTDAVDGLVTRTRNGGRIREFDQTTIANANPHGTATRTVNGVDNNVWKEFDQGKVVREKTAVPGINGRYRETDHLWGQWRDYQNGNLVAQKTISGRVWETDAFGQWSAAKTFGEFRQFPKVDPVHGNVGNPGDTGWRFAGRDMTFKGGASEFRGFYRQMRDPWHEQWTGLAPGGGESVFMSNFEKTVRKAGIDFGAGFATDFVSSLIVNGADDLVNHKQFTLQDVEKSLVSGMVGGAFRTLNTVLHDRTPIGEVRYGTWNVDFGKNYNRHNYASVDDWGSEWSSHEFPVRWRTATYDISTGVVNSTLSSFVSNTVNAAVFGVKGVKLTGADAALAGGWGAAGTAVTGVTVGLAGNALKTFEGSRWYHRGGVGEQFAGLGFSTIQSGISRALLNAVNIGSSRAVPPPPPPADARPPADIPPPVDVPTRTAADIPDTFLNSPDLTEAS